jgi:glutamyl-tRNA synthetase
MASRADTASSPLPFSESQPVIGRLAPSPTGAQHVGNARTYLIAWLSARSRGGRVVLRMEDIDSPRVKHGAAQQAVEDLRWLGLDWDEGPVFQTARLPLYEAALKTLQDKEQVYPCTCSRSDVERAASAPHAEHEGPAYPGTCAWRSVRHASELSRPRILLTDRIEETPDLVSSPSYAWRFRVEPGNIEFLDGLRGLTGMQLEKIGGDFVVWRSKVLSSSHSEVPAYQLAVVVDDAGHHVTEVIRGDDLVPSTPRQLLLYEALGLKPPRFTHVPLVVGPDGRRLAKRHGDTRLATLRQAGVQPEALLGLLAWSCGWMPKPAPISARELIPLFCLESIPREPFVLTAESLESIGYKPSHR